MKDFKLSALVAVALLGVAAAIAFGGFNAHQLSPSQLPAADFVVTSARDAGPGSLRDAILAADRVSSSAHINVKVERIALETALPALVNEHGIEIEAADRDGWIDATRQTSGAVLQLHSAHARLKGLHIEHARETGISVTSPGARLESFSVTDSKVGVLLDSSAVGSSISGADLERNETAVFVVPGMRDLTVSGSTFRDNSRAGFWFVGSADVHGSKEDGARERARLDSDLFEKNASGLVLANQPTSVQKSRFLASSESAVVILGGAARIEDNEIRDSKGNAVTVTSGADVMFLRNTLTGNAATALLIRDSGITVEGNTLVSNQLGIVSIVRQGAAAPVLKDNHISKSAADAITLIGGSALLQGNQVFDNAGVGLKELDLVDGRSTAKVSPHLEANTFHNNGSDQPAIGVYKLAGVL